MQRSGWLRDRWRAAFGAVFAFVFLLAWSASAQDRAVRVPPVALEDDGTGAADRLLAEARSATGIAVRFRVAADAAAVDRIPVRDSTPLWLVVSAPSTRAALDSWRAGVRRLIDRTSHQLTILEIAVDVQPDEVVEFAVKLAATELRARRDDVRIAVGGAALQDETRRRRIYSAALAPYVDLVVIPENARRGVTEWLARTDPEAKVALVGADVPARPDVATAMIEGVIDDLGTDVVTHEWRTSGVTPDVIRALSSLGPLLRHEIAAIDPAAVNLRVIAGDGSSAMLSQHLLFDAETFSTLFAYRSAASGGSASVSLRVPLAGTPAVTDLLTGVKTPVTSYRRDDATETSVVEIPLTGHPMLVDFSEGVSAAGGQSSTVSAERALSVGEIIARHRQQQLAQDRVVHTYIADATVRWFLRPTITDPGYDLVTENRYFVSDESIEWEQLSFSVNNRHWKPENTPPVPLLQPEQVFALPLQLRFDEEYTYKLVGVERVDEYDCYRVQFEPVRADATLYRGTVWIDRRTFARIQLQAVHGALPGMVFSNEETQHYAVVAVLENRPIFLLKGVTNREVALIAGRNIPTEKDVTFSGFRLNDANFGEERGAARRSDRVMYRETGNGLRPYVKQDGVRVVVDQPTPSVKALAVGTVVDPSYRFPLPIFGINYVDFAFGSQKTQLAMLFAGVLAAGNIQRPQLFGSKTVSASVDFFAIAAPSSDRVYVAAGEREAERLNTWPLTAGFNLGWQATPFQKWSAQYQFRFDGYARDTTTSESFVRPSSTVTNGIGGQWEYARGGYAVVLNGAWLARGTWQPWGDPQNGGLMTTSRTYTKYMASLSRDFLLNLFQKVNVNAAWFGGHDLDRFVQYQFGLFDPTRIHGVPAAVRFGELALTRGSYSFNVFDQYRLDLFLDYAWGREGNGASWNRIPGVGGAFNLPGPWNTIVRADVGKSWLPDRYGTLGSTVVQVMLLKPLR